MDPHFLFYFLKKYKETLRIQLNFRECIIVNFLLLAKLLNLEKNYLSAEKSFIFYFW